MNIFDILINSSVITDMRTNYSMMISVVVGMSLILMGLDRCREFLLEWHDGHYGRKIDKQFGGSIGGELVRYDRLAKKYRGTVAGDLYSARYRQAIRDYDKEDELEILTNKEDNGYKTHEELGYEIEVASNSGAFTYSDDDWDDHQFLHDHEYHQYRDYKIMQDDIEEKERNAFV